MSTQHAQSNGMHQLDIVTQPDRQYSFKRDASLCPETEGAHLHAQERSSEAHTQPQQRAAHALAMGLPAPGGLRQCRHGCCTVWRDSGGLH